MIHAYNEYYLPIIQPKLAEMFELAVYGEHIDIDSFASAFLSSPVCKAFETADPVFVSGKSSNELLSLILGKPPVQTENGSFASPEYWVGWVIAYAQWFLNKSYKTLITSFPCSKLMDCYFPYHEMDITKSVELIKSHLSNVSPLRYFRSKKKLSQSDLAILSGVPLRSIKAYEQGTVDIANAQAETLYALSKVLDCSIEDLIS
ncbi:MAG: helix-turn-helix domain-containing protein [Christensenellales bacterium]